MRVKVPGLPLLKPATWAIGCLATGIVLAAQAAGATDVQGLKKLSLDELMNMEVTSVSRAPERLSETASAIQVVTQEDIRRFGAQTLPEALRLANNLNVARKNSHDWGISARGFNTELANKLLVLFDGRTIYTPLFSGVRWDVQDYLLADLDRIEVISGPGGTLWGANAVNGVINIISKPATETQGFFAEAGTGNLLRQDYAFRYGGMMGSNISYRVYGKFLDHYPETLPTGAKAGDDWDRSQFGFRLDADAKTDGKLTLQGDYYRGTEGFVGGGTSDVSGSNVLGRWSKTLANGSDLSLQLYFDRSHLRQPAPASAFNAAGVFTDDLKTYDLDFQHRLKVLANQQLVWGFGYRITEDASQPAPGLSFTPPNLRQKLISGFVQDEITLRPGLTVTLGTKIEDTHYTGTEFEPTLRGQWAPASDSLLWAAVSRAVRTPSRIDHDLRQPATGPLVVLQGGQDFAAETMMAYEVGYRTQITRKIFGSFATFYNDYDKVRSLRMTPVTLLPFTFANGLEGHTYGGELTATYEALEWWRLTLGYNLLKESLHAAPGQSDFNNALNETADPEQQASLRSTMDFKGGFEFDANLRWVDQLLVNNVGKVATVPSYTELDAHLGWRPGRNWELSIIGQNLLHKQHPEFGVPSPARVELGRSVFVKSTWRF